jgi:hypothetical protein
VQPKRASRTCQRRANSPLAGSERKALWQNSAEMSPQRAMLPRKPGTHGIMLPGDFFATKKGFKRHTVINPYIFLTIIVYCCFIAGDFSMSQKMSPAVEMSPGISEGQTGDMGISLGTFLSPGISQGTKGYPRGQRDIPGDKGTQRGTKGQHGDRGQ